MTAKHLSEVALRDLFNLEAERAIDRIQILQEIDSTNSEALRQIQAGNTENRLVIAGAQTAGKGRRGRAWLSPKNSGIYLSLSRRFSQDANALQSLSLVTAISVVQALQDLGATQLQLKWPNDVLHEGRKLAGILLELQHRAASRYVVFGVGVNRELSAETVSHIDRPATDLNSILGDSPAAVAVIAALLNRICANLMEYESSGFAVFQDRWNLLDCYRMCDIVLHNGESRMIGKSLGVDASGALLLENAQGVQVIAGGEVFPSLRPLPDEIT